MSYDKEIIKDGKHNKFTSKGDAQKTYYTVLDGTDLSDVFIQKVTTEKNTENNSQNHQEFVTSIKIEKDFNDIKIIYDTDTTFPHCVTNGKVNCENCPHSIAGSTTHEGTRVQRFITGINVVRSGHTYTVNVTSADYPYNNCTINGGNYCSYCSVNYCHCANWYCNTFWYCQCDCSEWNPNCACASDGCGP